MTLSLVGGSSPGCVCYILPVALQLQGCRGKIEASTERTPVLILQRQGVRHDSAVGVYVHDVGLSVGHKCPNAPSNALHPIPPARFNGDALPSLTRTAFRLSINALIHPGGFRSSRGTGGRTGTTDDRDHAAGGFWNGSTPTLINNPIINRRHEVVWGRGVGQVCHCRGHHDTTLRDAMEDGWMAPL